VVNDAYAYCERLAREHYENFPVASRLLPRRMRPHVAAIYAFARIADDMADEGQRSASARLEDLDAWRQRLHRAARGEPTDDRPHAEVFVALRQTIAECRLPVSLLDDLLSAFAQDVTVTRYASWPSVLDYCRRSANPVGRLVLRVAGRENPSMDAASDAVCTALQLTNFWQDVDVDWRKGRLYVPEDVWRTAGACEADLDARCLTPEWRAAFGEVSRRTRALFAEGRSVCDGVRGRLRWELRATWLSGTRILDKLESSGFDVFNRRPTLSAADAPWFLWRLLTWRGSAAIEPSAFAASGLPPSQPAIRETGRRGGRRPEAD
jgi:hydroxysqualene synthase